MRCRYCFYADVAARRETASYGIMTRETAEKLVRRAFACADQSGVAFAFQGGEPTLAGAEFYRSFIALVKKYNSRRLPVSYALQTNGYEISDELIDIFKRNGFLLGVSVDGTREIHDALRGEGTFERAAANIARLKAAGIEFNILCVVTSQVVKRAGEVWDTLSNMCRYLQFIPCLDGFDGEARDYSLTADEYGEFLGEIWRRYERAYRAGHYVYVRDMNNYINIINGAQPEECSLCGVCGGYFLIEADGGVYPCDFYVLDRYRMGNINESSLVKLARGETATGFISESRALPDECRGCKWLWLCRNGCKRHRAAEFAPSGEALFGKTRFCGAFRSFFDEYYPAMERFAADIRKQ